MQRRSFLSTTLAAPAAPALLASLHKEIGQFDIVSSHEHLLWEDERLKLNAGVFTLAGHYLMNDAVSAGLPPATAKSLEDTSIPLKQRWASFEPYYQAAKFTGYGHAFRIAMKDIYGIAELNASTVEKAEAAVHAMNKPGLYEEVLHRRAKILYGVLDDYWHADPMRPDPRFFVLARKLDWFITPDNAAALKNMEKATGVSVTSLAGLKAAMEKRLDQSLAQGMVTLKSTLAYSREIRYNEVSEADAARDFEDLARDARPRPAGTRRFTERPYRNLEDHMFHHAMRLAEAHSLPVQIHTGTLAGNSGWVENTRPMHLQNIFNLYPKVTFDLFHIGYPYIDEITVLGKIFPNVNVDFCWAHILSPSTARRALSEMLDAMPYTKILGFGGDYRYAELTYAHSVMARENIAMVLSEKVAQGWCKESDALEIAKALLATNTARLFPRKS
ncbi:MAG TPA: amidohydrolase family protein [Bryobacteraceae bacterium]|nr:amidohydrolase family protein [Bryobacteraceae bacterium]HPT27748.1 amidohydrolase family protein [Bryobacteraceae bacterium]